MSTPFSLRIFVADGDPDGLRVVERSNWIGKALMFPRALLPQGEAARRAGQTGVYLLLGPREDGEGEMLYVGEGDPIRPRLEIALRAEGFLDPRGVLRGRAGAAQQGACAVPGGATWSPGQGRQAHAAGQRQPARRADAERGRPRRHAGVPGEHAGHAAGAGRAGLRAGARPPPRPPPRCSPARARACWPRATKPARALW